MHSPEILTTYSSTPVRFAHVITIWCGKYFRASRVGVPGAAVHKTRCLYQFVTEAQEKYTAQLCP